MSEDVSLVGPQVGIVPIVPLPYRTDHEVPEQDEDETARALIEALNGIGDKTFEDTGLGLRPVHAKSHALLRGELHVLALAPPYAQGLYAHAATHPVAVRLSTSPGDLLDDRISTPRGFALKVMNVQGARLPGSEQGTTQDFLLVNGPAFLAPDAGKFLGSLKLLAATTDKIPRLKRAFSALAHGAETALEAVGGESAMLKGMGGHPHTHILGETFYSQVPFLYGPFIAKWSVAPVSAELKALKDAPVDLHDRPDGLREAVSAHFATHGATWELRVQLCVDLERMPIEDASVAWPEEISPFVTVARIVVPPQESWSDARSAEMDDGLAFSPWQGLAAHRPLGGINRARRLAYPASARHRSPRGRCPVGELES